MVQICDRAPEFVVASLERVADDILRWTSRGPDARRGLVGHRRRPGILCKGSLRRIGGSKEHRPMSVVGVGRVKTPFPGKSVRSWDRFGLRPLASFKVIRRCG